MASSQVTPARERRGRVRDERGRGGGGTEGEQEQEEREEEEVEEEREGEPTLYTRVRPKESRIQGILRERGGATGGEPIYNIYIYICFLFIYL